MKEKKNPPKGTGQPPSVRPVGEPVTMYLSPDSTNYLVGRVLTLIDAISSDPKQREAVKSLARQTIWSWATEAQSGWTVEMWDELQRRDARLAAEHLTSLTTTKITLN